MHIYINIYIENIAALLVIIREKAVPDFHRVKMEKQKWTRGSPTNHRRPIPCRNTHAFRAGSRWDTPNIRHSS